MDHPSETDLVRYAFDPSAYEGRAAIEAHVASCTRCRRTVEFSATLDDHLGDPFVWDEFPAPAIMESLRAHAVQIAREDAAAEALLGTLTATATA